MIDFNINGYCLIKLTNEGKKELERQHNELNTNKPYKPSPEDRNGYSKWQMHDIMSALGHMLIIGSKLPFHPEIKIVEQSCRTCRSCKFRNTEGYCTNEKLTEYNKVQEAIDKKDKLICSINTEKTYIIENEDCVYKIGEKNNFWVGKEFGCIHFCSKY